MTSDYFTRISHRIIKYTEQYREKRTVCFFTQDWPYEEVNKLLEECEIKYHWGENKNYLELKWDDISYKKIQNIIDLREAQKDFQ